MTGRATSNRVWRKGDMALVESRAPMRPVRVMAVADNYAMVRVPGAVPFVVPIKELRDV